MCLPQQQPPVYRDQQRDGGTPVHTQPSVFQHSWLLEQSAVAITPAGTHRIEYEWTPSVTINLSPQHPPVHRVIVPATNYAGTQGIRYEQAPRGVIRLVAGTEQWQCVPAWTVAGTESQ